MIADSHLIIAYLRQHYDSPLDRGLTSEQRAVAMLVGKALDEQLYWGLVYSRWIRSDTWPRVKAAFFNVVPAPMRAIVSWIAQRRVRRALYLQGFGRHSDEEILAMTTEMLQALSDLLGDKVYLLGEQPSTLDATAFGFLSEFILSDIRNSFSERARGFENLVCYCERIRDELYPDDFFNR
ncbi:MAG: glutathione S-transferase family protein [Gammaproteobacteria bacterium]|nr:glutathione S-transferase family protein [Gammaproteobacteria bacterium]